MVADYCGRWVIVAFWDDIDYSGGDGNALGIQHPKPGMGGSLNHGLRCRLTVEPTNIFIQEFDKSLTAHGLDCFQYFQAEFFDVIRLEVFLQFARTSPHESAERAWVRGHVFIPHVSIEFLDSPKVFATIQTGRARHASGARGTISPVFRSALDSEMSLD